MNNKKILSLILLIFGLFGVVYYFSLSLVINTLEDNKEKDKNVLGISLLDGRAAAVTTDSGGVEYVYDVNEVDVSVFAPINLRFAGETYIFSSSWIRDLLGDNSSLEKSAEHWDQIGRDKVRDYLEELFELKYFDRKSYQMNTHGVDHRDVRGFEYYEQESSPDVSAAGSMIHAIIEARLQQNLGVEEYLVVRSKEHLGTNGEYTEGKYIELDHSAQKIYAWEGGELYKSWYASGFFDEYAVFGVFDVKNKSLNAWSPVVSKWMPYWMAYYYDPKQQAWFGIHELVYWFDDAGNRLEESSESIGYKKSGGCVRLDRGEMIELYNWAEVGIPFLIYE